MQYDLLALIYSAFTTLLIDLEYSDLLCNGSSSTTENTKESTSSSCTKSGMLQQASLITTIQDRYLYVKNQHHLQVTQDFADEGILQFYSLSLMQKKPNDNLLTRFECIKLSIQVNFNYCSQFAKTCPQPAIACSKLTIETLEQGEKYVQS